MERIVMSIQGCLSENREQLCSNVTVLKFVCSSHGSFLQIYNAAARSVDALQRPQVTQFVFYTPTCIISKLYQPLFKCEKTRTTAILSKHGHGKKMGKCLHLYSYKLLCDKFGIKWIGLTRSFIWVIFQLHWFLFSINFSENPPFFFCKIHYFSK